MDWRSSRLQFAEKKSGAASREGARSQVGESHGFDGGAFTALGEEDDDALRLVDVALELADVLQIVDTANNRNARQSRGLCAQGVLRFR